MSTDSQHMDRPRRGSTAEQDPAQLAAAIQLRQELGGLSYGEQLTRVLPPAPHVMRGDEPIQCQAEGEVASEPCDPGAITGTEVIIVAPSSWSTEQKLAHYERIIAYMGGTIDHNLPVTVIGIRGYGKYHVDDHHSVTGYHPTVNDGSQDDTLVVINQVDEENPRITQHRGRTHPTQDDLVCDVSAYACPDDKLAYDMSGQEPGIGPDGHPDVGRIRPGRYVSRRLTSNWEDDEDGGHDVLETDSEGNLRHSHRLYNAEGVNAIPADRDANQDRVLDDWEIEASRNRGAHIKDPELAGTQIDFVTGDYATEVDFHSGSSSIGCQTIRDDDDFGEFLDDVGYDSHGHVRDFNYILVDANELAADAGFVCS